MRQFSCSLALLMATVMVVSGCGSSSDSGTNETSGGSTPGAVTGLTVTPGNGQNTLTWNRVEGAVSYEIYWSSDVGANGRDAECDGNLIEGITGTSYVHTGLTNGVGYRYAVTAITGDDQEGECPAMTELFVPTPSGGGTPPPRPTIAPTNGVCGTAHAKTYQVGDAGYGPDSLCAAGTVSPAIPAFPAQGGSSNWTCLGANGGGDVACSASRNAPAPVDGACGTADGKTYLDIDLTFGADTLCVAGTVSPASPTFPAYASTTNWSCLGMNGGADAPCSASRNPDTTPPTTTVALATTVQTSGEWIGSATINDAGTGYCTALASGAPAPTALEVKSDNHANKQGTGGSVAMTANVAATCTVTGLAANTPYDFYFVAEDAIPNLQTDGAVSGPVTATLSVTGTATTQLVHGVSTDQIAWLVAKTDTNSTGYCVAVPQGGAAPTVAQIAAGAGGAIVGTQGTVALTANTSGFCTVTGLTASTAYDLYFVAKDGANAFQAAAGSVLNTSTTVTPGATPAGMVAVLGGCYMMGDNFAEGDARELPLHPVCLSSYFMDATEVTQAAFGVNPNGYGNPGANNPAERVDLTQASAYCAGRIPAGRVPTEAEWEYAARERGLIKRPGTMTDVRYGTGTDVIDCATANQSGCVGLTRTVKSYLPNALGLYDMAGNVWEHVTDWYDAAYYAASPITNPTGPGDTGMALARGGSYLNAATFNRAAKRLSVAVGNVAPGLGFRCVVDGNVTSSTTVTTQLVHGVSTDSAAWLVATTDTNSTGYCVAVPQGGAAPTVVQIVTGSGGAIVGTQGTVALTANVGGPCPVTGLTPSTSYDLYFVAKDAGNAYQATAGSVANVSTTTAQGAAPAGMVAVPGGCFMMGDNFGVGIWAHELPLHPVCLSSFYMDASEVTQAQHQAWGADTTWTAYGYDGAGAVTCGTRTTCPAESVDWANASQFCVDNGKRLPTEAEWEYAAREGGKLVSFGTGGDAIDCTIANGWLIGGGCPGVTTAVGSYAANALGLTDMSGNVAEWVSDWYGFDYYATSPIFNPTGPVGGAARVLRGGAFGGSSNTLRAAYRASFGPTDQWGDVGWRCARN